MRGTQDISYQTKNLVTSSVLWKFPFLSSDKIKNYCEYVSVKLRYDYIGLYNYTFNPVTLY